jgi:hypothetical protein
MYQDRENWNTSESQLFMNLYCNAQLVLPISPEDLTIQGTSQSVPQPSPQADDANKKQLRKSSDSSNDDTQSEKDSQNLNLGIEISCTSVRNIHARFKSVFLDRSSKKMDNDVFLIQEIPSESYLDSAQEKLLDSNDVLLVAVRKKKKGENDYGAPYTLLEKLAGSNYYSPCPKTKVSDLKRCFEGGKDDHVEIEVILLDQKDELRPKKERKAKEDSKLQQDPIKIKLEFPDNQMRDQYENSIHQRAPKPGLKQEFDLTDASDKVITLLSRMTMSNKWSPCSSNVYGTPK